MQLIFWFAGYLQLMLSFVSFLEIYTLQKGIFKTLFMLKCLTLGSRDRQKNDPLNFVQCDLRQTGSGILVSAINAL